MSHRPIRDRATTAAKPQPHTVVLGDSEDKKGRLKSIGGSRSDRWNNLLVTQLAQALWPKNSSHEEREQQLNAAVAALAGIAPKDELEGMMAAQLIAAHNACMNCYRRAVIVDAVDRQDVYLAQANKLSRTYATLLEALNRHRGKGQQHVTVEHVHVNGGQAIVGAIQGGGTGTEGQSYASRAIAHEPGETLPRKIETVRKAVPIARG